MNTYAIDKYRRLRAKLKGANAQEAKEILIEMQALFSLMTADEREAASR